MSDILRYESLSRQDVINCVENAFSTWGEENNGSAGYCFFGEDTEFAVEFSKDNVSDENGEPMPSYCTIYIPQFKGVQLPHMINIYYQYHNPRTGQVEHKGVDVMAIVHLVMAINGLLLSAQWAYKENK